MKYCALSLFFLAVDVENCQLIGAEARWSPFLVSCPQKRSSLAFRLLTLTQIDEGGLKFVLAWYIS